MISSRFRITLDEAGVADTIERPMRGVSEMVLKIVFPGLAGLVFFPLLSVDEERWLSLDSLLLGKKYL